MSLLPARKNFADLQETAERLIDTSPEENMKRLLGIVGEMAFRCDNLEREVEKLGRLHKGHQETNP